MPFHMPLLWKNPSVLALHKVSKPVCGNAQHPSSTKDMQLLSDADAFLINGAGMELFLEQAAEQPPMLPFQAAVPQ